MKPNTIILGLLLAGCQSSPSLQAEGSSSPPAASAGASAAPANGAQRDLDSLDSRRPVPLIPMMAHHQKQNMRDHLLAIQEVVEALSKEDFGAAAKSAERLGPSEGMLKMCNHMGSRAPGFTPQAVAFHETAAGIETAARAKDARKTLAAVSDTLKKCNGCHATFKQSVVDMDQWSAMPPSFGAK